MDTTYSGKTIEPKRLLLSQRDNPSLLVEKQNISSPKYISFCPGEGEVLLINWLNKFKVRKLVDQLL